MHVDSFIYAFFFLIYHQLCLLFYKTPLLLFPRPFRTPCTRRVHMSVPHLRLRARYGDGSVRTFLDVPSSEPYADFLLRLHTSSMPATFRVLRMGTPVTEVHGTGRTVGEVFRSGECIIVEHGATSTDVRRGRRRRTNTSMVQRAQKVLTEGKRTTSGRRKTVMDVNQLQRGKRDRVEEMDDDERDADWTLETEEEGNKQTRTRRPRRRTAKKKKTDDADGEVDAEVDVETDALDLDKRKGQVGAALLQSFISGGAGGGVVKEALKDALRRRKKEAVGERRYAAVLAGRYRLVDTQDGNGFRVEFQGELEGGTGRSWEKDLEGDVVEKYGKENLALLVNAVMEENHAELKERLKMMEMAKWVPRVYWNFVKEFGKDVENGVRTLAAPKWKDWGFLGRRVRERSEKGKQSKEREEEMQRIDKEEEEDRKKWQLD